MAPFTSLSACVVLVLACLAIQGDALKCFICSSLTDGGDCEKLHGDKYLKNCTENSDGRPPIICRTDTTKLGKEKNNRVIRTCGYEKHPRLTCYNMANIDFKSTICECSNKDGCNSSARPLVALGLVLLASVFHLAFSR